jgi:hypothetical protein
MRLNKNAREPTAHAKEINSILYQKFGPNFAIRAYGKNSIPLSTTLAVENNLQKTAEDDEFIAHFTSCHATRTVHFFVRYFEHCVKVKDFVHLKHVNSGDLVYIETLDFGRLSANANFSFIWPKRLTYGTSLEYGKALGFGQVEASGYTIAESEFNLEPFNWSIFDGARAAITTIDQLTTVPIAKLWRQHVTDLCAELSAIGV